MDSKKNDTTNFRKLLAEEISWPHVYMFKFIIPADQAKQNQIIAFFPSNSDVSFKASRTGKYTSVTIKALMQTPEEVINHYEKAAKIDGIISL